MPARLHVVSIHPQMSTDHPLTITLIVAGESWEKANELMRNMENSRHFRQTQVLGVTNATSSVPGDNVQFDISSSYVPETESKRSTR